MNVRSCRTTHVTKLPSPEGERVALRRGECCKAGLWELGPLRVTKYYRGPVGGQPSPMAAVLWLVELITTINSLL